jgi:hypothetical protein
MSSNDTSNLEQAEKSEDNIGHDALFKKLLP